MSTERKALRADLILAVTTAINAHPPLAGRKIISAWSQKLSGEALPAIGIAVPSEQREAAAHDTDAQEFRAMVVIKIACPGDDSPAAEDALDDVAEALAGPIEAALMSDARDVALISSSIEISAAGSPRVGTLTLTFGASTWRGRTRP